jgi:hypothetical protein
MDATHLPSVIGLCERCLLPLYAHAPIATQRPGDPTPALAHVGCEVNAHRHGQAP